MLTPNDHMSACKNAHTHNSFPLMFFEFGLTLGKGGESIVMSVALNRLRLKIVPFVHS